MGQLASFLKYAAGRKKKKNVDLERHLDEVLFIALNN